MFKTKNDDDVQSIPFDNGDLLEATFLGADAFWKGELSFKGTLCIDGKFEGRIKAHDTLVISETGDVNAIIHAGTVICKGVITGDVVASQRIVMHSKSKIVGDVKTPSINIESGAVLDGKCDMSRKSTEVSVKPRG